MKIPDINWYIHRIAVSEYYSDPLHVIQTQWSIDDAADAHDALNYMEMLQHEADRKLETKK